MERALLDWPIVLQYEVKAKYRLISKKFSGMKFFSPKRSLNQPIATRVCIRSINQSNRSISVRLFFSVFFARFHFKVIRKSLYRDRLGRCECIIQTGVNSYVALHCHAKSN